jgi:hypothetical protein
LTSTRDALRIPASDAAALHDALAAKDTGEVHPMDRIGMVIFGDYN